MQLGDTVNLVRKYTGHILDCELIEVLRHGSKPMVVVCWRNKRASTYKLDLDKNQVLAIDATQRHRQDMLAWWEISEAHRKELTELFWDVKKKGTHYAGKTRA